MKYALDKITIPEPTYGNIDPRLVEFYKKFRKNQDRQFRLMIGKNNDYAGIAKDQLVNLRIGEPHISAIQYCMLRILDKGRRVINLTSGKTVQMVDDEKIEDTCDDVAVYANMGEIAYETDKNEETVK